MKIYKVALGLVGTICALAMSASIARSQQKAALSPVQVHMVITDQALSDSSEVILVMGHANCGAVKATIQAKEVPGQISALYPHIQPAVDQAGANFEAAIKANAKIQTGLLPKVDFQIGLRNTSALDDGLEPFGFELLAGIGCGLIVLIRTDLNAI
jgi:hypothetical protein